MKKRSFVCAVAFVVACVTQMLTAQVLMKSDSEPTNVTEKVAAGLLPANPADWDEETRKEFFGHMPEEFREPYLAAFAKLHEANAAYMKARAELFTLIHPLFPQEEQDSLKDFGGDYAKFAEVLMPSAAPLFQHWEHFRSYPDYLNPADENAYWKALAQETLFQCEKYVELRHEQAKETVRQTADYRAKIDTLKLEDLPDDLQSTDYFTQAGFYEPLPPTKEMKAKILRDEPLFVGQPDSIFFMFGLLPRFDASEFLSQQRKAELEPWKMEDAPELLKLDLTLEDLKRWDGSLSLHPFLRNLVERLEKNGLTVDWQQWETSVNQPSGFALPSEESPKILSNTHPAILSLIVGEKDLVFSARNLSPTEATLALEKGVEIASVPFAKDAFVFLQNRHLPVRNLTREQYQGIFRGKYRNWKEVGGFGGVIQPLIRNENSGSEEIMQTLVMRGVPVSPDFAPKKASGMSFVFEWLGDTPTGIAYSIFHYDRYMMFDADTRVMAVDGVFPTVSTIESGEYPLIYTPALLYRKDTDGKDADKKVRAFADWLLAEEGQRVVRSLGYVPIAHIQN